MPRYEQATTVQYSMTCCEKCGKLTTGLQQRVYKQFNLHQKICKGKLQLSKEVADELMRIRFENISHEPTKVVHTPKLGGHC